jgi:hypothetical protein
MRAFLLGCGLAAALGTGQAQAAGAPALDDEHAARKAEIAAYTTTFDGGAANLDCVRPSIPPTSKTNEEIAKVDKEVQAWFDCYNAFTQRLNEALPPGKAIPAGLARIMRPEELAQARARMNQVYGLIADEAQATATALVAEHQAWRESTMLFATTKNAETKQKMGARILEYELMMQRQREFTGNNSNGRSMTSGPVIAR